LNIIGLTGGSGTGKTHALGLFAQMGAMVLDCDGLYHQMLEQNKQMVREIGAAFPSVVANDTVNRRALGQIVFGDAAALLHLNSITHPHVRGAVEDKIKEAQEAGASVFVIEAVALFESSLAKLCDKTIALIAPREVRIRRIVEREGCETVYATKRVDAQQADEFYQKQADVVIENNQDDTQKLKGQLIGNSA